LGIDILVIPEGWYINTELVRRNTRSKIIFSLHSLPLWEVIDFFTFGHRDAVASIPAGKLLEWYLLRFPRELLTGRRRKQGADLLRRNYLNSDAYTVICEPYKQRMLEILGPTTVTPENNHIAVVPNFVPWHDYGNLEKKKRVLFIGRLKYSDKRVDRLLDIWAMVHRDFPDWELCIVGDGQEKERLMRRSERLRLTNVRFCGYTLSPEEYYASASIVCLASNYEGWPLVIAEGQQAGAIPVAFDVSAGIREQLLPSGVNGILVEPFDKKEYARQLARLMGDEDLREDMRRNVIEKSREYSRPERLARWEELMYELLKK
jgi:glycosyltransferase involved in cell wall biosynthesis